jgi:hypothetical protein
MPINPKNGENSSSDIDAGYERIASQEEIYLEETEEELRAILIFDTPCPSKGIDETLDAAVEELITGDSDDPPLSKAAVEQMIRMTHMPKRHGS